MNYRQSSQWSCHSTIIELEICYSFSAIRVNSRYSREVGRLLYA